MATPGAQVDPSAGIGAGTLAIVRNLLVELGSPGAIRTLETRGPSAHLERDLGLGSLERVELLIRLDRLFSVRLPSSVIAGADTVQDVIDALSAAQSSEAAQSSHAGAKARASSGAAVLDARSATPSKADFSAAETLTEILVERGRTEAGRAHIYLYGENDNPGTITCGELFARASSVAAALERRGLEPGSTVAIMLPTCAEFFSSFAGILLAGGIPVPIYPPFRADRIEEYAARQAGILRNAEARFLITFREAHAVARLMESRVPSLRGVLSAARLARSERPQAPSPTEARPADVFGRRSRSSDIAFLQYTSGSTGDPKGVVLTHANLLANLRSIVDGIAVGPEDVAVSWLPLYHDMGLIGAWFVPLYSGIPLVVMSPLAFLSRPESWLWALCRHRGTLSPAPNFAFELCIRRVPDSAIEGLDLSSVRALLNGAEPVRPETLDRFAARFERYGLRREALMPVYGLAEASLGVSAPPLGAGYTIDRIDRETFESERRAIPVALAASNRRASPANGAEAELDHAALEFVGAGRPLPGTDLRIVDDQGRDLPQRTEGHLWFRGPSATSGYYRNPEATKTILRQDGFLDSGDLAYIAAGELFITGRAKDIIIKGGRNIYPQEVEEIAGRVPGVRTGCVVAFGVADPQSGTEKFVVAAESREQREADRISSEITEQVVRAMGIPPDRVELLPPHSIPKTSSGKLRRSETRRLYLAGNLGKRPAPVWVQIGKMAARSALPRALSGIRGIVVRGARAIYGCYALTVMALLFVPLWALTYVTTDRMRAARIARFFSRAILFAAGIRIRINETATAGETGQAAHAGPAGKPAASGPSIFAANHSSYLDTMVLTAVLPPGTRFVAKSEVFSYPVIGLVMRRGGHFGFERCDPQARLEQARVLDEVLARGESIAIFPEGTFTETAGIRPFQLGAFKAAVDSGTPICPVAIRGTRQILRDKTILPRPGRISLEFGPLLSPNGKHARAATPEAHRAIPSQSAPAAGSDDWLEMVRLRDESREIIARNVAEPLL